MFRPLARSHRRPHRRGTSFVLIVVVMISFAASVGVAFALFAGQTLRISRAHLEGQGGGAQPLARAPEPSNTVNRFFSSLIFDAGDDTTEDLTNALRGHSIARSMYGGTAGNTVPWAGVGTFREPNAYGDRSAQVNYTQMTFGTASFLLDPEYMGQRGFDPISGARTPLDPTTRSYVGKHAGYSYPDLKDFFSAAVSPATGQVLVPSFHRPWLWNSTITVMNNGVPTTVLTTLGPDNPNWNSPDGRLKTLRPRPAEHPKFPRVPTNADGTYTGDVQNWPGGFTYDPDTINPNDTSKGRYYAKNDSLWMHIGLPTVPFGNRQVQPLVAALIVPLDGLFNASVHGNNYGPDPMPPTPPGQPVPRHMSYAGLGPWEVNVGGAFLSNSELAALPADRLSVVRTRGTPVQNNGTNTRSFDPYRLMPATAPATGMVPMSLPAYAPVAWNGTQVGKPAYPAGADLTGVPVFPGFQSGNQAEGDHPALFSPTQWGPFGGPRVFSLSNLKRLHLRYAFTPDWYFMSDLAAQAAPNDLFGTAYQFSYATGRNTLNSYRLDPAHANRALFTTRGFGIDRPKVAPNFAARDGAAGLAMAGPKPGPVSPGTFPMPGAALGAVTDFSANRWVNRMAALGAVDLNRPLADYRRNTAQPLSAPNNVTVTSAAQADTDRRKFAHDIFVRLAAATGASLQIGLTGVEYPTYQYSVPPVVAVGSPQYNALRYLAQLAVNIVDYRDDDDISTAFVWNPLNGNPNDPTNFTPAEVGNRVVFGVEKPRLVLNEVYSEMTNSPRDTLEGADTSVPPDGVPDVPLPSGSTAYVRFWAELLNPTKSSGGGPGPIDDNVALGAYQIQIARANRVTGAAAAQDMVSYLYDPANTTGSFPVGQVPDASYTFNTSTANRGSPTTVSPNNGVYGPILAAPNTLPLQGFVLVAPPAETPKTATRTVTSQEFNPQPGAAGTLWAPTNVLRSPAIGGAAPSPGMGYTLTMRDAVGGVPVPNPTTKEFRRNVVLLRRLANPYVVPDPTAPNVGVVNNPYVTVDMMDYVPTFDAIHRHVGDARDRGTNAQPLPGAVAGYDPLIRRQAVGKVQPYAGHAAPTRFQDGAGTVNWNTYTFPTSMVLGQTPAAAIGPAVAQAPRTTFGRHNGTPNAAQPPNPPTPAPANTFVPGNPTAVPPTQPTLVSPPNRPETIMTPFDWFVHMDRAVVNEIELFQVRDTPPHLVTDQFLQTSGAAPGVTYEAGYGRWRFTNDGIGRALEYLTVKPHMSGVAHGGRVPGKIGINALPDKRVLNGLMDPQLGNEFTEAYVNNVAWGQWMATRGGLTTRTLANGNSVATTADPGQSIYDGTGGGTNRPFQSIGAAAVAVAAAGSEFAYAGGGNENLTVLRYDTSNPTATPPPYLYTALPAPGATYTQPEPLRKIRNNITEVNHTYAVFLTVGYFELDFETLNPVTNQRDGRVDLGAGVTMSRLAHEACLHVPGDMRQKFFAVIDMSNMVMDPMTNVPAQPFFTTLEATARPGSTTLLIAADASGTTVTADGVPIGVGGTLVLGYGAEEQKVTVTAVQAVLVNGVPMGQVTFDPTVTPLTRTAWAGSSVSNVRPGYPGVQGSNFKYNDPLYKPVIPYLERVK